MQLRGSASAYVPWVVGSIPHGGRIELVFNTAISRI